MVDIAIADLVKSTSTSEGTGAFVLDGAVTGFDHFSDALNDGDETWYVIRHANGTEWETGRGTWDADNSELARNVAVFDSSAAGALVDFSAGSKTVAINVPAAMLRNMVNRVGDSVAAGKSIIATAGIADNKLLLRPIVAGPGVSVDDSSDVLTISGGGSPFEPCTLATTEETTLSSEQTVDTGTTSTGMRVLVMAQNDPTENGLYVANNDGAWTRAPDADTEAEFVRGRTVVVTSGVANGGKQFYFSSVETPGLGVAPIAFTLVNDSAAAAPALADVLAEGNDADGAKIVGLADGDTGTQDAATVAQSEALVTAALAAAFDNDESEIIVHNTDDNLSVIPTKPVTYVFWTSERTATRSVAFGAADDGTQDGWRLIVVQVNGTQTHRIQVQGDEAPILADFTAGWRVVEIVADSTVATGNARLVHPGEYLVADGSVKMLDGSVLSSAGSLEVRAGDDGAGLSMTVRAGHSTTGGSTAGSAVVQAGSVLAATGTGGSLSLEAGGANGVDGAQLVLGGADETGAGKEAALNSCGFVGLTYLTQDGADPATVGWLRGRHNQSLLVGRSNDGLLDIGLISWGTVAADELRIGGAAGAKISFRVATTTGSYDFLVGTGSRFAILDGEVNAPVGWSNPNDAENTIAFPAARASFQGTINTASSNQATFTIAANKSYLVTAWAIADDGASPAVMLWSETVTGVFYRGASGNAVSANDDTAIGGKRVTYLTLAGFVLTLVLSTNTLQAKVANTSGTNRNVTIVATTTERDYP